MTEIRSHRCSVLTDAALGVCVDIIAGTYTDLDGLACYTPRPDGVTCCSSATAYTACTKQQENHGQEKMTQSRDVVNTRCMRLLPA